MSPVLVFYKNISTNGICIFFYSLFILLILSTLNGEFQFIEDKVASKVAYTMYETGSFTLTFYLQYLLSYLGFLVVPDTHVTFGLNIALQSYFFLLAHETLIKGRKGGAIWIFLLLFFPSFYHYSIFGLRDPLVNILSLFFILLCRNFYTWKTTLGYSALLGSCVIVRPELCAIFIMLIGLRYFLSSSILTKFVLVCVAILSMNIALVGAMSALGVKDSGVNIIENIEKLNKFNEARNDRRLGGDGGGSAVLGGKLFQLPFYQRYVVQVAATVMIPLPHEIRGVTSWLGLVDSLFFITVMIMAFRYSDNKLSKYLFLSGIVYILIIAIFTMNYGNTLRMRYPIFIFFFAAACHSRRLKFFGKS